MVGLMPAPADVRRHPSPNANARPVARGRAGGCSRGVSMEHANDGGMALSHWLSSSSKVRRRHNIAGGHRHTGPEPTPQGGAANAHRRGAQHQKPHTAGGGSKRPPQGGGHNTRTYHRGGGSKCPPQGGTTPHTAGRGAPRGAHHRGGHQHTRGPLPPANSRGDCLGPRVYM